jgi:adenylyltransferase/sulfurtransferase
MLDGWDEDTQKKLKNSKVFIAGVGGLGCPAALNLAIAGVGHIVLCDSDTVDITNLNRQFLHQEANVGVDKTSSARDTLKALNSEVLFETFSQKIIAENVEALVGDADIIIDCLDNFTGRFVLNQYVVEHGIPMVHGAVWGM